MNKDGEAFDKKKSRTKGGTLTPLYEDEVISLLYSDKLSRQRHFCEVKNSRKMLIYLQSFSE